MIKRLCCAPSCCKARVEGSKYCEKHREQYESADRQRYADYLSRRYQHRESKYADLYKTAEWKALRADVLRNHPYCECCGTKYDLQVHHSYPKGVDYSSPEMFFNTDALSVLCRSCHAKETDKRMG